MIKQQFNPFPVYCGVTKTVFVRLKSHVSIVRA